MSDITLYGLANCDTCRKARRWLTSAGIEHGFVDVRTDGVDTARLDAWVASLGWETLLNRRSTTWRQLDASDRENLDDARARRLLAAHPALIKRPVLETPQDTLVGFSAARYETALAGAD